ncbi:hypothetical protein K9L27_01025 [Candidatus Gracilibacteria bacterium]|nr:hypothetical protein [Candidatus Gracilibacteria bacterium]
MSSHTKVVTDFDTQISKLLELIKKSVDEEFFRELFTLFPKTKKVKIASLSRLQKMVIKIDVKIFHLHGAWITMNGTDIKEIDPPKGISWSVEGKDEILKNFSFIQNIC